MLFPDFLSDFLQIQSNVLEMKCPCLPLFFQVTGYRSMDEYLTLFGYQLTF